MDRIGIVNLMLLRAKAVRVQLSLGEMVGAGVDARVLAQTLSGPELVVPAVQSFGLARQAFFVARRCHDHTQGDDTAFGDAAKFSMVVVDDLEVELELLLLEEFSP